MTFNICLQMDLRYKSVTGRGFEIKLLFAGIHIADVSQTLEITYSLEISPQIFTILNRGSVSL